MGVPTWLLKLAMAFLSDRTFCSRNLLGCPQGTLPGLLQFLVLNNDIGFKDHVNNTAEIITSKWNFKAGNKIVDDLTVADAITLEESVHTSK